MATLRRESDGSLWSLPHHCTVGRSPIALLRVDDPRISVHHAEILFDAGQWWVRDRDSRNGTQVDGRRLPVEGATLLTVGARLLFGRRVAFVVDDLGPPVPMAADLDEGGLVAARGGVLALPDDTLARVQVFAAPEGYRAEIDGEPRAVTDGRLIELGARAWRLCLPPRTATPVPTLRLALSGGDLVSATVTTWGGERSLPPQPHHGLLLRLASSRRAEAHLAPADQGWLDAAEVPATELLALRRELCGLWSEGAALIERRRSGEVRLALPPDCLMVG